MKTTKTRASLLIFFCFILLAPMTSHAVKFPPILEIVKKFGSYPGPKKPKRPKRIEERPEGRSVASDVKTGFAQEGGKYLFNEIVKEDDEEYPAAHLPDPAPGLIERVCSGAIVDTGVTIPGLIGGPIGGPIGGQVGRGTRSLLLRFELENCKARARSRAISNTYHRRAIGGFGGYGRGLDQDQENIDYHRGAMEAIRRIRP